jgi:predicted CopG family antitoxin
MATKSITIDLGAYERLKGVQKKNESFSQVIKRVVPKPFDLDKFLGRVKANPLSADAVEAIEEQVRRRSQPSNRDL